MRIVECGMVGCADVELSDAELDNELSGKAVRRFTIQNRIIHNRR